MLLGYPADGELQGSFDPVLKQQDINSLVVEGYIDGAAPSTFKISRSRKLTVRDTATRRYELGAAVSIEDDHQNTYPLTEQGNGIYSSVSILNLNPAYQYRVHIFTSGGIEYASDLVPYKQSPAIDTVDWEFKDDGVQILLNTHDPNNATKYYRWEYNETWEFHASFRSYYKYDPVSKIVIPRTEDVEICWQTHNSNNILLGSSAKLSDDVIYRMPLTYIEPHDDRISVLYSILVKQYALDANGYNYYVAIRNNTERVGSIFDPQPNQTQGNLHCVTNPAENVIGYINAGGSVVNRIFISNRSLPASWKIYPDCPVADVPNIQDSIEFYFEGGWDPISKVFTNTNQIVYPSSYSHCVDCTLAGTTIKPSFWP